MGAKQMLSKGFRSQPGNGESGFSIIEMLIAMVVLTVGLVSIVGISVYVSRANSTSNEISVLAAAAQDQVDRIRTAVWSATTEDPMISVGGSIAMAATPPTDTVMSSSLSDRVLLALSATQSVNTSTSSANSSTPAAIYQYKPDPDDPHRATVANTPVGDLIIRWSVRQGSTPDLRYVTIKVTPALYSQYLKDGFTVSTIINRN
jgi:prepilin-type N-terminal cleavage/methylation domain-containing protein